MLTIATWNLENLFRPGAGDGPTDEDAYHAKLTALAGMIEQIAPDVLAVQEVGDPEALDDLRARLEGEWHRELSTQPDGRGIRVGFLSRHPLTDIHAIRAFPPGTDPVRINDDATGESPTTEQMGRGALRARITVNGTAIELITCHLKSKLLHFPGGAFSTRDEDLRARYAGYALGLRTAEAITLRHHATQALGGHGQDRALIILGDLNDEPLAATTQILLGPPGSEFGTGGFDQRDQGDGQRLWNIAPRLPEGRNTSRIFNGRGELIDHILISHKLARHLDSADIGTTELPSITTNPTPRRNAPGSDHAPVLARFTLG